MLTYKSSVWVAGQSLTVVEDYEAILARMKDASFKQNVDEPAMDWPQPIELTACGQDDRPLRVAIAVQAISAIFGIPHDEQPSVNEAAS